MGHWAGVAVDVGESDLGRDDMEQGDLCRGWGSCDVLQVISSVKGLT